MCVIHLKCGVLQHMYVMVLLILPFELNDFKLAELNFGRSLSFFGIKFFNGLLGKTITVLIESFGSCEAAFEDVRGFTLLELLLVMRLPRCE